MSTQTKVAGVILAGGQARRMNHLDKGLIQYKGLPMVSYAIEAMRCTTSQLMLNANRNRDRYIEFGFPVIADLSDNFEGPLAGILSALTHADAEVLLVMPCDSPLFKTEHLRMLLTVREKSQAEVSVAFDGQRVHPVFLAIKTTLIDSLREYLANGQRKLEQWLEQHDTVRTDFSHCPEVLANINTMTDLCALEVMSL